MKLILLVLLLAGCMEKETPSINNTLTTAGIATSNSKEDDFSDFKKKDDESCDGEEDIHKKIQEKLKKEPAKAFKLQGGEADCAIDAAKKAK